MVKKFSRYKYPKLLKKQGNFTLEVGGGRFSSGPDCLRCAPLQSVPCGADLRAQPSLGGRHNSARNSWRGERSQYRHVRVTYLAFPDSVLPLCALRGAVGPAGGLLDSSGLPCSTRALSSCGARHSTLHLSAAPCTTPRHAGPWENMKPRFPGGYTASSLVCPHPACNAPRVTPPSTHPAPARCPQSTPCHTIRLTPPFHPRTSIRRWRRASSRTARSW